MTAGDPSAAAAGDVSAVISSPSPALFDSRLREALVALSQSFDSGDATTSEDAAASLSDVLNAAAAAFAVAADGGDGDEALRSDAPARASEKLLSEVHAFLSCPSANQMAIDALSLVLPKPVAKLGALALSCKDIAGAIIKFFVTNCSPRDMLSILCEALDAPMELPYGPAYFVLLLNGLAEVLTLIQRRHIEQVKVVLPAVLKVMHATVSECDEDHGKASVDVFNAALRIGKTVQEMCKAMVSPNKEYLCAILGLYSLQNIAFISQSKQKDIATAFGSVALQYSQLLKFCGFTYVGMLTGIDATVANAKLSKDDDADFMMSFSFVMDGAILSELELALKEVQDHHAKKWEAINMLRYVLTSFRYPWIFKSHCINLLLNLAENRIEEINDDVDFTSDAPRIFTTLKAIENVMMTAPEPLMRKNAFVSLKKVISMVPSSQRFDILRALINNSVSHSLTAILLDIVRDEVLRESRQPDKDCASGFNHGWESPPWASHALDLVKLILRPPEGGPPCLPDQSEQVLSALNLLRFILMIGSRESRLRKLLCKETLQRVHSEWLMPLRPIVAGIQSESEKDGSEIAYEIMCSLNPVQLVLYRCIELVEEKMNGW